MPLFLHANVIGIEPELPVAIQLDSQLSRLGYLGEKTTPVLELSVDMPTENPAPLLFRAWVRS